MKFILVLALVVGAGCSDGGSAPVGPSPFDLAQSCTSASTAYLSRVVVELAELIRNPVADGAYSIPYDFDYDGVDDSTIEGTVTNGTDLMVTVTLTGRLTGSGALTLATVSPTEVDATGSITIGDGTCEADLSPGAIRVALGTPLSAGIAGAGVSGATGLVVRVDGHTLDGSLDISAATQQATFTGTLNGETRNFSYDIYPSATVLAALADCAGDQAFLYNEVDTALLQLAEIVNGVDGVLADIPATNGLETVATANQNIVNYRLQLADFGTEVTDGTIVGQVRISRLDLVLTVLISWQLTANEATLGNITGRSDRFMRFIYDGGSLLERHGAGTIAFAGCSGGFDIPDDKPRTEASGEIAYRAIVVTGDTLVATFALDPAPSILTTLVNGIPAPPDTILD